MTCPAGQPGCWSVRRSVRPSALAGLALIALGLGLPPREARADEPCVGNTTAFTVLDFSSRSLESEVWIFGQLRTRVQKCQDRDLARQIRDGRDLDQLLNRRIVMALIEVGDQIRYYILPSGVSLQPPTENRCTERVPQVPGSHLVHAGVMSPPAAAPASPRGSTERWKALLGAAIALFEERRLLGNPCAGDPQAAVRLINQARASLTETNSDPGEKTLQTRLDPRELVNRATAGGCGPRELNRRVLEDNPNLPGRS